MKIIYDKLYNNDIYIDDIKTAIDSCPNLDGIYGKSILVTGATGIIGSFLVDVFMYLNKEKKAEIIVYASGRSIERLSDNLAL